MGAIDIKFVLGRTVALAIIQLMLFVSKFVAVAFFNYLATAQFAPAPIFEKHLENNWRKLF